MKCVNQIKERKSEFSLLLYGLPVTFFHFEAMAMSQTKVVARPG